MTFSRLRSVINHTYFIHDLPLTSAGDSVLDLGFTLTQTLCPGKHIETRCCKAFKLLGFIFRISREFHLSSSLKTLYCSLIRPIVEYGSVIWDPVTSSHKITLERVQRKFLRLAAFALHIQCPPHDYTPVLEKLSLLSLSDRRHQTNLNFLSNILSGRIDCPSILSLIKFKIPARSTRSCTNFHIPFSNSNYQSNSPLIRLMRIANESPSHFP